MPSAPLVERLPDEYLLLIGEVLTAWSLQEHELRLLHFLLLGLDPKRGRLGVKSVRAKEAVELAGDLLHLEGLESKTTNLKELAALLEEIETRRNALAHNVWLKAEDGRFFLQSLTGTWPADHSGHRRKRRVDPAGIPVEVDSLTDLVKTVRQTTEQTRLLRREVASRLADKGRPVASPLEE